jgi:hypothetical protein
MAEQLPTDRRLGRRSDRRAGSHRQAGQRTLSSSRSDGAWPDSTRGTRAGSALPRTLVRVSVFPPRPTRRTGVVASEIDAGERLCHQEDDHGERQHERAHRSFALLRRRAGHVAPPALIAVRGSGSSLKLLSPRDDDYRARDGEFDVTDETWAHSKSSGWKLHLFVKDNVGPRDDGSASRPTPNCNPR